MTDAPSDPVPAPALREVAQVWWDVDRDPVVAWSDDARTLELRDREDPSLRLVIATYDAPPPRPDRMAATLAEGLAACDFPPTGDRADPEHVRRALEAGGL